MPQGVILDGRPNRAMANDVALIGEPTCAGQQLGYCRVLAMLIAWPLNLLAAKSWQIRCTVRHILLL